MLDPGVGLGDEQTSVLVVVAQAAGGELVETRVSAVGVEVRLPHDVDGRRTHGEGLWAGVEYQDPGVAHIGHEQPLILRVVGDAARAGELARSQAGLPRREVRLAEHNSRVHARLEPLRPDVEDQHPVVGAVAHEQALMGIVYRDGRTAAHVVGGEPSRLGVRIGLAEDPDDCCARAYAVWVDIEDHDLAAGVGLAGTRGVIDDEQPLVEMIHGSRSGELRLALRPMAGRRPPGISAGLTQDVIRRGMGQRAVFIELEDLDTAVPVARYEEPTVDAIQRPLRWSPNAVTSGAAVGHSSDERRVAPEVLLAEQVGGRLPVVLSPNSGGQKETAGKKTEAGAREFALGHGDRSSVFSLCRTGTVHGESASAGAPVQQMGTHE